MFFPTLFIITLLLQFSCNVGIWLVYSKISKINKCYKYKHFNKFLFALVQYHNTVMCHVISNALSLESLCVLVECLALAQPFCKQHTNCNYVFGWCRVLKSRSPAFQKGRRVLHHELRWWWVWAVILSNVTQLQQVCVSVPFCVLSLSCPCSVSVLQVILKTRLSWRRRRGSSTKCWSFSTRSRVRHTLCRPQGKVASDRM